MRAAAAAAALLTAALTVGASPAYAGGPTVEFSGGSVLSLLVCKSTPSASKVNVGWGGEVAFVNRLGQAASLKVNGGTVSQVPANSQVAVHFNGGGQESVSMAFDCGVGVVQEFKAVNVTVDPPPAGDVPVVSRGGGGAAAVGGAGGSGVAPTGTHKATTSTPAAGRTSGTHAPAAGGSRGGSGGTAGESGTEPIDPSLLGPSDLDPSAGAVADQGGPTNGQVYVEAAVPASGTPRNGPAGLLALIATVCVVGVGMAAIRAIIAKRSLRTDLA